MIFLSRRRFLGALPLLAGGLVSCGRPADSEPVDMELEALRRAAARPGPAEDSLRRLAPPARRAVYTLPFGEDALPGFSAATHRVHHRHHYQEYLLRWEKYERWLLLEVPGIPLSPNLLAHHETMRSAANMVVLHEIYWNALGEGLGALAVQPSHPPADTTLTALLPSGDAVAIPTAAHSTPLCVQPLAVMDWMTHAWRLDFADVDAYARQVAATPNAPLRELLQASRFQTVNEFEIREINRVHCEAKSQPVEAILESIHAIAAPPDPDRAIDALRRLAGPTGWVAILRDTATNIETITILRPDQPTGIWRHELVAAAAGI